MLPVPGRDGLQKLDTLLLWAEITDLNNNECVPVGSGGKNHIRIQLPWNVLDAVPEMLDKRGSCRPSEVAVKNNEIEILHQRARSY